MTRAVGSLVTLLVTMNPHALAITQQDRTISLRSVPFLLVHVVAIVGVAWLGWSWTGLLLAVALYYVRMFGVSAGYHRYFSHRSFRTSRPVQFALALLATSSVQKGVLWWASHHRAHHKHSDQPGDVHSAARDGFLWSHLGWILSARFEQTDRPLVNDLAAFPELVWLERWHLVPPVVLAVGLGLVGGPWAVLWGFFVSTVLLWHGTFTINSLAHRVGRRRYPTGDESKNSLVLALLTMGEGWHNNHHHYQRSSNQGFYWWEIDCTQYLLRAMAAIGIVWDLHGVPRSVRQRELRPAEQRLRLNLRAEPTSART